MMHPGESSPHGAGNAPEPLPFSAQEWQSFRKVDKAAGAYIVSLMAGIFSVGLVLYLIVLWSVI